MPRCGDLACMEKDLTPCAAVGPPFQGFKFCCDLFPGRCPGLAWAAPLGRKIAVSVKLGFGVGFWRWVLVLGFGGPERARHDSPGQRPGLNAPMISSPEGAAPLARENGPMTETGDTHVSLSMPRTKSRCPPTPAPHTPQLEKGMCRVSKGSDSIDYLPSAARALGQPRRLQLVMPEAGEDLGHPSNFQPRQEVAAPGPFASVIYPGWRAERFPGQTRLAV